MKLFVWDFHGVLEKDNEKAVIDISNRVLAGSGHGARFTVADNDRYYGLKWHQYFERLLPELGHEEHLALQARCFEFTERNPEVVAGHIKPNDHAVEVLATIAASGHQQVVISNSRQGDLLWFLDAIGIKDFFDDRHVIGVNAHQAHGSKTDALRAYVGDSEFDRIIVVGDSEGDMQLGEAVAATTYYYRHPDRIHDPAVQADYTTSDLRAVLAEL